MTNYGKTQSRAQRNCGTHRDSDLKKQGDSVRTVKKDEKERAPDQGRSEAKEDFGKRGLFALATRFPRGTYILPNDVGTGVTLHFP